MRFLKSATTMIVLTMLASTALSAGTHEILWHTIDGGGATAPGGSTGGSFELAGTIGQPDAGSISVPMAGGTIELIGGFWVVAGAMCSCTGDMNHDGYRNGADIQKFVDCIIGADNCICADVDQADGVSMADIVEFVSLLLNVGTCP